MEGTFLFCRGREIRKGAEFVCPHSEFCLRYSRKAPSPYHHYGKTVPVDNHCSCRYFKLNPELAIERRTGKMKKERVSKAKPKKVVRKSGRPRKAS